MKVLVTNDDGIGAEGLLVLSAWAHRGHHEVMVVAPKQNCSGQSGAITLGKPLTVTQMQPGQWAVGGTPADCVRIALGFLEFYPDVVLSGINHGANLGQDVHASGTVGAALMAATRGIPAAALSACSNDWPHMQQLLALHGQTIVDEALASGPHYIVSANFPADGGDRLITAELSGPRYDDQVKWDEVEGQHHIVRLALVERNQPHLAVNTDAHAIQRGLSTLTYLPVIPTVAVDALSTHSQA